MAPSQASGVPISLPADVTLICDGHKTVRAHKAVLSASACSPVLASIFRSTDDAGKDTVITIDGVKHTDLENVLNFIFL